MSDYGKFNYKLDTEMETISKEDVERDYWNKVNHHLKRSAKYEIAGYGFMLNGVICISTIITFVAFRVSLVFMVLFGCMGIALLVSGLLMIKKAEEIMNEPIHRIKKEFEKDVNKK